MCYVRSNDSRRKPKQKLACVTSMISPRLLVTCVSVSCECHHHMINNPAHDTRQCVSDNLLLADDARSFGAPPTRQVITINSLGESVSPCRTPLQTARHCSAVYNYRSSAHQNQAYCLVQHNCIKIQAAQSTITRPRSCQTWVSCFAIIGHARTIGD